GEVDVPVHRIGQALGLQFLNEGDHLTNMPSRARLVRRRQAAQGLHVLAELTDVQFGEFLRRYPPLQGTVTDLVVHVRVVEHEGQVVPEKTQVPVNHGERDQGAGVADVRAVIHRNPADVHADFARREGDELFVFARERVVKVQGHKKKIKSVKFKM